MSASKLVPDVFAVQGSSADPEARDGCDTEKQAGPDTGGLQESDVRLFQENTEELEEVRVQYHPSFLAQFMRVTMLDPEETISKVKDGVRQCALLKAMASNVSFLSCLGSLVLQPDAFLPSLSLDDLHPCQSLEESEVRAAVEQGGEDVSNAVKVLRTASPGLLPSDLEQSLDPGLLSQFLLDQGPCYCRHIFAALESGPGGGAGKKGSPIFLHPLSRPVSAAENSSWSFQSRTGNTNHGVSDACCAQDMLKRLLESDRSILEYMSFLPSLVALMEANKALREFATSAEPKQMFSKEQESSGNTGLRDRQEAVLKLMMFFVPWGLTNVNLFTLGSYLGCSQLQQIIPIALTASVAEKEEEEEEEKKEEEETLYTRQRSGSTEPAMQPRCVTVEDLEAFVDMKQLLRHATTHTSQGHRDTPRLPTPEACSCGRPLMADMMEASAHLQRVWQERASAPERGQTEMKQEQEAKVKSSTTDESFEETPLNKIQVSEQEKAMSSVRKEQTVTRSQLAQGPDSVTSSSQAPTTSHRDHGGEIRPYNNEEQSWARADGKATQGGSHLLGSSTDAPQGPGEKDQHAAGKLKNEAPLHTSAGLVAAFAEALQELREPLDPDVADAEAGQPSTSGNKQDDSGTGGTSVERSVQDDRASGNSCSGLDHLPRRMSSMSSCLMRSTEGQNGGTSSEETGEAKRLDVMGSTESERKGASKSDKDGSPPRKVESKHVTDVTEEAGESPSNENRTIRNLSDLLLAFSEAARPIAATANASLMSMMMKGESQKQSLLTTPREARHSEDLAERYRVALLSTPVSYRDALAAVEVLHFDCPRFLALCHRSLGCSCGGDLFTQATLCGGGAAAEAAVKGEGGGLASLLLGPNFPAAGTPTAADVDVSKEENHVTSSDHLAAERPAASSDEAPRGAEEKRGRDPRQEFSTESLKTWLRGELQRAPHKSHCRLLLEEDCLQAFSDVLVHAAVEEISEEELLASVRRAQLVVQYNCRSAMQPLRGLEALAVDLMEKVQEHGKADLHSSET